MVKNEFYNEVCVLAVCVCVFFLPMLALPCIVSLHFSGRHHLMGFFFTLRVRFTRYSWILNGGGRIRVHVPVRQVDHVLERKMARGGCDSCMTECTYFLFITEVIKMSVSLAPSRMHYCARRGQAISMHRCILRSLILHYLTKIKLFNKIFIFQHRIFLTRFAYAIMAYIN